MNERYFAIAKLITQTTFKGFETEPSRPYKILETYMTIDGPRTRCCDGLWHTEREAREALAGYEKKLVAGP